MYNWLLFGHILFVVIWVGGAIVTQILLTRASRSGDPADMMSLVRQAGWAGTAVFMPASILVLVFGILLVVTDNVWGWGFEDPWITIGFAGFLATAITGSVVLGPRGKRLGALAEQKGPTDPEVQDSARKLIKLQRIDLVVLVLVILDMVIKPGFERIG